MSADKLVIDFLHAKHNRYEWKDLDISEEEKIVMEDTKYAWHDTKVFDLWEHDFDLTNNLHITKELFFHYVFSGQCRPFIIKIENLAATITKGHHLKRQSYREPFAIGQTGSLWRIHNEMICKLNEQIKKTVRPLDVALIHINAGRLPLGKITYFRNLKVVYEKIETVNYRGKEKYCLVARVLSGQILLPKKKVSVTFLILKNKLICLITRCIYISSDICRL